MSTYLEIIVKDADEEDQLLSFYVKTIGFSVYLRKESDDYTVICSSGLCAMATAAPTLIVIRRKTATNLSPTTASVQKFHFIVENPTELQERLERKQQKFHAVISGDASGGLGKEVRTLYVNDPLGNCLQFSNESLFDTWPLAIRSPSQVNVAVGADVESQPATNGSSIIVGRKIAFLTSGGDCSGMNASIRSIVRYALAKNCEPFAVYEGYQGLVDGGSKIVKFGWENVAGILHIGGTIIGSARCKDFRERPGRLKAAYNLISLGIDCLIVNGGDGSLTGANLFRSEWKSLIDELVSKNMIASETAQKYQNFTIVGMVGSIDNDMVGTELTIGANSSLHRIIEAVDSISSTASSHQRAFVIEVMGRHCGWLALMASIAVGADWTFIPEQPHAEGWEDEMCKTLRNHRELGKRKVIVIVAEGAIDYKNLPIKCEYVKDVLTKRLGLDTRVTTLGHVQRGGTPSAFDRVLATLQGVKAVDVAINALPTDEPVFIGYNDNKITCQPLMKSVELTQAVGKAIAERNFHDAFQLRDPDFRDAYRIMGTLKYPVDSNVKVKDIPKHEKKRIAFINVGAPSAGMDAASRAIVRYCIHQGHCALAIFNGFDGLANGDVKEMAWIDVDGWISRAGSRLGTNRTEPSKDIGRIAFQMQRLDIHGLILVGGFEAFTALHQLTEARASYPAFCIPMICLPSTLSNNVPGTEFSLGSDTALNAIVDACDTIKFSASASRNRVFIVEVQGANCGFLATTAGLAAGAITAYIPEEEICLQDIQRDIDHLKLRFREDKKQGRIIIRNENSSDTYTTGVLTSIFMKEGSPIFDSRNTILGHLQQGNSPSPLDRIRGTRLAVLCANFIEGWLGKCFGKHPLYAVYTEDEESACVIGIKDGRIVYSPISGLAAKDADIKKRISKTKWWIDMHPLVKLLAKY